MFGVGQFRVSTEPRFNNLDVPPKENLSAVVSVSGEIDLATAPVLRQAIGSAAESQGVGKVVVDMAAVSFIDSTGVTELLGAMGDVQSAGGSFTLSSPSRQVLKVISLCKLDRHFHLISREPLEVRRDVPRSPDQHDRRVPAIV